MLCEPKNPATIKPQAFPNGIAALYDGIKWADSRFVPTKQSAVYAVDQILIDWVVFLEHFLALGFKDLRLNPVFGHLFIDCKTFIQNGLAFMRD